MKHIEETFRALAYQPVEKLFYYVTNDDGSEKKYIAQFLIERHLSRLDYDMQKWARWTSIGISFFALLISVIALAKAK